MTGDRATWADREARARGAPRHAVPHDPDGAVRSGWLANLIKRN